MEKIQDTYTLLGLSLNLRAHGIGRVGNLQGIVLLLEIFDHSSDCDTALIESPVDFRGGLRVGQDSEEKYNYYY